MADLKKTPEHTLWNSLSDSRDVLLGTVGDVAHFQPMAPQVDESTKSIWFFTSKSTDLAKSVERERSARICHIAKDRDFHACIDGLLAVSHNAAMIEKYWSPVVAAWYPQGKNDPNLTMMRFNPQNAAIWVSTDSAIKFGWEIMKANVTGSTPDVGFHTILAW